MGKRGTKFRPIDERFMDKVDMTLWCWNWTAAKDPQGYGRFAITKRELRLAHRVAFELFVGPIPDGHELDHLCRNPSCVNPKHLEPVTRAEHARRSSRAQQTHCLRGHLLDEANVRVKTDGTRDCRICGRMRCRARREQERSREVIGESLRPPAVEVAS